MRLCALALCLLPGLAAALEPTVSMKIKADDIASGRVDVALGGSPRTVHRGGRQGPCTSFLTAEHPFTLSIPLPAGNVRVRLTLGDHDGRSNTTVKAEARRLMLEAVTTAHGAVVEREFIVNLRTPDLVAPPKFAPGGASVRLSEREIGTADWDEALNLEFSGPAPKLCALEIEPVDVPTVYIVGDSTVTDHPWEPYAAWGQMLPRFFKPQIAVANHAFSGETLKSFATGLRLDKVLSDMREGDWLLIQFGHNDQKSQWPQTYVEAGTTYKAWLRVYIEEARRRGAQPALVTSPMRRQFDAQGRIINTLEGYPQAMRELAKEQKLPLIDLNAMSARFYEALGPERAPRAFAQNGADATHHNNYGAYELARAIAEDIRTGIPGLAAHLADDTERFDPDRPIPPEAFTLPASPAHSTEKPRGN